MTLSPHSSALHPHPHPPSPPLPGEARGAAAAPAPARRPCCGRCSWSQVRDGCQVSSHTGPEPGPRSVALCIAAGQETDCEPWLSTSAPETVPSARGLGGASLPSQTSCRAPDVDLSGPAEAENTAKTQSRRSTGTCVSHSLCVNFRLTLTNLLESKQNNHM